MIIRILNYGIGDGVQTRKDALRKLPKYILISELLHEGNISFYKQWTVIFFSVYFNKKLPVFKRKGLQE